RAATRAAPSAFVCPATSRVRPACTGSSPTSSSAGTSPRPRPGPSRVSWLRGVCGWQTPSSGPADCPPSSLWRPGAASTSAPTRLGQANEKIGLPDRGPRLAAGASPMILRRSAVLIALLSCGACSPRPVAETDDHGIVRREGQVQGKRQVGAWTYRDASGAVEATGSWEGDKQIGPWVWYHPDGSVKQTGTYLAMGLRSGWWSFNHPGGA